MSRKNEDIAIVVQDVTKHFKLFYDKPNTLKERLVFWKNKKKEERVILRNIDLKIKKQLVCTKYYNI